MSSASCSGVATWASRPLTASIASLSTVAAGTLGERRQLQQFEVAGDRPVDVDRGVEARLAQFAPGLPGSFEHFVAHHPVGRVEILGRAEQFFLVDFFEAADHREGVVVTARPAACRSSGRLDPGEHRAFVGRSDRGGDRPAVIVGRPGGVRSGRPVTTAGP